MDKLLHTLLHGVAHAVGHAIHHRHKSEEARRHHYEGMSAFANFMYTACQQLGYSLEQLEPAMGVYVVKRCRLVSALEDNRFHILAGTPFRFSASPPAVLGQILEIRNNSLKYGFWKCPRVEAEYVLMYQIDIKLDSVDAETLAFASQYAVDEVNEFVDVLHRQGFRSR